MLENATLMERGGNKSEVIRTPTNDFGDRYTTVDTTLSILDILLESNQHYLLLRRQLLYRFS